MDYNVWLGNPYGVGYQWQGLCEEVAARFGPVIGKQKKYGRVRVRSTMDKPALLPHELLIYVVPTRGDHRIIAAHFGGHVTANDQFGYTA